MEATTNFEKSELFKVYFASIVSANGTIILSPYSRFFDNNEMVITKLEVSTELQSLVITKS